MAKIEFKPIRNPKSVKPEEVDQAKAEAIANVLNYKTQNPVKFEAKKTAMLERFGLTLADIGEKAEKTK